MAVNGDLARRVVEAGGACSLTTAVLEERSTLGTPKRVGHLAGCLERREDLVLMGDVGTGKTHMASALCMLACERGLEARFFTASSLVMRLRRARDEGRLDREAALIGRARTIRGKGWEYPHSASLDGFRADVRYEAAGAPLGW